MRCSAVAAGTASSARLAMLKEFHASHHGGDPLRLGQLVEADRAEARVPDQALVLQFGQRLELPRERAQNHEAVVDPGGGG
jgi:hypothetical protein